jgi:hypothetical protein
MTRAPLGNHGWQHSADGQDPGYCGRWHNVGAAGEPTFQNGWTNMSPTGSVPNPVPLRFRISMGPPNVLDASNATIMQYQPHQVEIQGDITGGSTGTVVFQVPVWAQLDYDVPMDAHDSGGNYVPCRLLSTGYFYRGVA